LGLYFGDDICGWYGVARQIDPLSSPTALPNFSVQRSVQRTMTHSSLPPTDGDTKPLTPLRALTGAVIAGGMTTLLYRLTTSVVQSLMTHPTISHSTIVMNLSAAVRTLVIGGMTMGTGIFGFVTLGLVALAVKLVLQPASSPNSET
jgi:Protein of unknown function (DUF3082)